MTKEELQNVLTLHAAWLKGESIGKRADLRSANLRSANLRSANLRYADLRSADLRSANLRYADLRSADLSYADLRSADLSYADLSYADLRSANLRYADLSSADLRSADLLTFRFNRHALYFTFDGNIRIGCHSKTIKEWKKEYKVAGKVESYTTTEIAQYKAIIDMCERLQKKYKPKKLVKGTP